MRPEGETILRSKIIKVNKIRCTRGHIGTDFVLVSDEKKKQP